MIETIVSSSEKPKLRDTKVKVYPYMSQVPLELSGKFDTEISSESVNRVETFYVAKGPSCSLVSWKRY